MLSAESAEIVRATVPAVRAHGSEITGEFYASMFTAHPELLDLFNRGNQATGEQRQALAASVVAFAEHLLGEGSTPFEPVLARIAHKHAALGVSPVQYTIVGRHLMTAVGTVLGAAVTPAVAAAWDEVYWLFGCLLVAEEARLYQQAGVSPDHLWRPWLIVNRVVEAEDTVSLSLEPADGGPVPAFLPGQYVSVAVELPDGSRQPRQYTVSEAPGRGSLRLTIRRVRGVGGAPDGMVSTYLHESAKEGMVLTVGPPFGDVTLAPGRSPLVLVSAGVGITPMMALLDHVARTAPEREVVLAHADRSPASHAFRDEAAKVGSRLRSFRHLAWYEAPGDAANDGSGPEVHAGLVDPELVPLPDGAQVYLCGPLPFMRAVRTGLLRRGVPADRIRYEVFGPDLWAGAPPTDG
ncbi:MAG: hemin transporter [Actinobacteria bacterium]|nr:hemin transporter [Actinomycetota bacterium]